MLKNKATIIFLIMLTITQNILTTDTFEEVANKGIQTANELIQKIQNMQHKATTNDIYKENQQLQEKIQELENEIEKSEEEIKTTIALLEEKNTLYLLQKEYIKKQEQIIEEQKNELKNKEKQIKRIKMLLTTTEQTNISATNEIIEYKKLIKKMEQILKEREKINLGNEITLLKEIIKEFQKQDSNDSLIQDMNQLLLKMSPPRNTHAATADTTTIQSLINEANYLLK